jgi:hypothetical protein
MHPYDQAYSEMMREMSEPYQSRYGKACEGTYAILVCGHLSTVQVQRHPGCYKCAEARPALCQPAYPKQVLRTDGRRCGHCQAAAERKAR